MGASAALAATAPYSMDFDGGAATGFTTAGQSGVYTIQAESSGYSYQAALAASTGNQSASSGIPVTNLPSAACVISTDFKITSYTANGSSIVNGGLAFCGDTADFSAGHQYRLYYQITNGTIGKLQLMRGSSALAISTATMAPQLNTTYTVVATLSYYDSGELTIHALLYNSADSIAIAAIDNAPLPGTYAGYRTAISTANTATGIAIRYDNFSITLGNGSQEGDGTVDGNLSVGGSVDIAGNTITLGASGSNYGTGFIYDPSTVTLSSQLTQSSGVWNWLHGSSTAMMLDAQNQLSLIAGDGASAGVLLDPNGISQFNAVRVSNTLSAGGSIRTAPAGDLSMGSFTAGTNPATQ